MKKYESLIFDLDDTLTDNGKSIEYAFKMLIKYLKIEYSDELLEKWKKFDITYWHEWESGDMVIPNSMGVVISLIEIIIYINYEKKYPAISTVDVEGNTNEEIKKEESEIKNIEDNKSEDPKEEPEPEPQPVNIINQNDN